MLGHVLLPTLVLLSIFINNGESSIETCGRRDKNGVTKLVITASSTLGPINLYTVQFDSARKLPITSTALHNALNQRKTFNRTENFRIYKGCAPVSDHEMNCGRTYKFTPEQREKSGYLAFDRGHLVPANPNRFSEDALSNTFYCVNMAPQDPFMNRDPWSSIEALALTKFKTFPGFVMTGLCDADSSDGPTNEGYANPACYWKLICYKDPKDGVTQVIGFIADNSLVNINDKEAKQARRAEAMTPRSQSDIEKVTRPQYIAKAWKDTKDLLVGRKEDRAPDPKACIAAKTISEEAATEFIKLPRKTG